MPVTVHEVLEESRNDPDQAPQSPATQGSWTWWRTGPHPQGVWQAMDWTPDMMEAYQENRRLFPVEQDRAHGAAGDFGNFSCHACDYFSDGYPEPNHRTACDGVCRRGNCAEHSSTDFKDAHSRDARLGRVVAILEGRVAVGTEEDLARRIIEELEP